MKLKSLKPRMYNAIFHTHTVSGIVISFALYVIFFCGAISLFMHEMYRWENPEARFESMPANQVDYDKITSAVQKNVKDFDITSQFSLAPPTKVNPFVYFRGNTRNTEGKTKRFNAYINPKTYEVISIDEPKTHMADTIYELHFFSQIPMVGGYLAGLVSFFFIFAIITGLLIHWKNIVNKFYSFTAKGKWKQIWTNSHISLGFIALPFQLIYAVTGAILCLSILLLAPSAFLMFNGNSSQISKAISPTPERYKFDPKAKTQEKDVTLNEIYKKVKKANPQREITYLSVNHYTKADGTISVSTHNQVSLAGAGLMVYGAKEGKLLQSVDPDKKPYSKKAYEVLFQLHFGSFGGILLKIIYFILSLITCYIIISGVMIWRTARDNSRYTDKQRRFHHRVTKFYLAISLSMYPALALIFLANISVPMHFVNRVALVDIIFFAGWLVLTIIGLFWNNYRQLNRNYILLGSIMALLIPIANGLFTGDWIWHTLINNQTYVYAVDITWLSIGIFGLLIVKKYLRKDYPKLENTPEKVSLNLLKIKSKALLQILQLRMVKLLLALLLLPVALWGQNGFHIKGQVHTIAGHALPWATVKLSDGAATTTATDTAGRFEFSNIQSGKYILTITAVGFNAIQSNITVNKNLDLSFTLNETVQTLEGVTIVGKNRVTLMNEQEMTITSLNVKKMADFSMGAEDVLKTATGVVVRQFGGLGSPVNINLNGLTGDAVRTYYDGIPLETYGHAIQLNTIPVDALERIDVYKGVTPVDIGTDALGGGINLVPLEVTKSQLRASYSVGSFNTHRLTLNGTKNWNDKTSLSVSSFFNYSDNNYTMRDVPNLRENLDAQGNVLSVSEETIDAERFHNQHQSSYIEASLSLNHRAWADKFTLSASHSYRADEIQQGQFVISTAVGEAQAKVNGFTQRLDYRKNFFDNKLSVRYFGILSNAFSRATDSTQSIYNWLGQKFKTKASGGSEIFGRPTLREGNDLGTTHRFIANYPIASNTSLKFSDFFSHTRIKGEDPEARKLEIEGLVFDPNTIPSKLSKNIIGAELAQYFFDKKLTAVVLFKNYYYTAESIDILASSATILPIRKISESKNGYGLAFKYDIHPAVFVRGSFEKAVRIPRDDEVFGDFLVILPNYLLQPEVSNNYNAGIAYRNKLGHQGYLSVQVDAFVRDRKNLIRLAPFGPENAMYVNEAAVDGNGIEFASKLNLIKYLNISWNATYQSSKIAEVSEQKDAASIGLQIPNIPRFFYNIGADYIFKKTFQSPNSLKLFWNFFYIDRFSINEVADLDKANPTFVIPVQHLHNAGANYSLVNSGLSFSLNVQNVFNAKIYDNFRVPRPGFNYAFKINYTL